MCQHRSSFNPSASSLKPKLLTVFRHFSVIVAGLARRAASIIGKRRYFSIGKSGLPALAEEAAGVWMGEVLCRCCLCLCLRRGRGCGRWHGWLRAAAMTVGGRKTYAVPLKIRATGFAGRSHSANAEIQLRSSDLLETRSVYSRKIKGLIHFFSPADARWSGSVRRRAGCSRQFAPSRRGRSWP